MAPPSSTDLLSKSASLRALAARFTEAIPSALLEQFTEPAETDPLAVLADAPKVFKAQATKAGLLLVNKPFTPSAIHGILQDLEGRVVPALFASSAQVFGRKVILGEHFANEVTDLLKDVLGSVGILMDAVDGTVKGMVSKEGVMVAVGKVYSACDELVALANGGVVALLMRKVKSQMELIEDAISELQEWEEESDDGDSDEEEDEAENQDAASEQDRERSLEELTGGLSLDTPDRVPKKRADILRLVKGACPQASLINKLLIAMSKRRIKRFSSQSPPFATEEAKAAQIEGIETLSEVVKLTYSIQSNFDEFAASLYDLDAEQAEIYLGVVTGNADTITQLIFKTWDGKEDEFTEWLRTWRRMMGKASIERTQASNS
ncbi:hypothetical protein BT63DRAFT_123543 [Microthyrium microscopicum]|uniref:Cyclin-D1-binding protein 1-like N-terminal domain-containing protein n=1 Tax=Microthyrium microscopicum TaxID=703497 RepID=A0A6A6TV00_9PEZI|nr:hypothetical protein BT63DRAFT_123543 [Microthyrium microscopicum]